ncbi:MAG: hypothetical protein U0Y10_04255 [Spirosomataceae bacterium]
MFVRNNFLFLVVLLAIAYAFAMKATIFQNPPSSSTPPLASADESNNYWKGGLAELSTYSLEQTQNGQTSTGEAVLVFVPEDFRTDKQVKLSSDKKDLATSALKMNGLHHLTIGASELRTMTSVFSPTDLKLYPHALKVSTTVQDWDGQSYIQLNLKNRKYEVVQHGYTEEDAHQTAELDRSWLEDELWTRLRLQPDKLPTGELSLVPSTQAACLLHRKLSVTTAQAKVDSVNATTRQYVLEYPDRTLKISFERVFPHQILGWEDTFKQSGKPTTTKATLKKKQQTQWPIPANKASTLRDSLQLRK